MAALEEIQKAGRMVGVITHVEAMKEVLPIGIRVDRLPNDKGSTLELLPDN
jgi:DNA repair exonuclease SbcCD ATPase subunit